MQNVQPALSPDGRLVAYHSVARGGIWLVPALGGIPRPLTSFGSHPAWSPDGSRIAFQSQAWVGSGETLSAASEGSTIWLVPASGGEPMRLTSIADVGPGGQGAPAWSPDSRLLSFLSGTRVFTMRADGSGLRGTSGRLRVYGLAWEKGGRSQVWTGFEAGNWCVWRVAVSPETGERTGEPQVLASGGERASAWAHPAPSPDGRSIAYVTFRTRYALLTRALGPDGRPSGEPVPIVPTIGGRKVPFGFSPDGTRFAFTTARPGVGPSLWVVDLASGDARLVVETPDLLPCRAWFADGRRLGYVAPGKGAAGESGRSFWSVDVVSGETREHRPVEPHLSWAFSLSPDGRSLLSHGAREGALNVWSTDLGGGEARRLTDDPEGIGWPVWSPDGRQMAVEMMRGGDTRIGLLPAAGGTVREVVSTPGQNWPHSFSPDGRRLAFAGQRRGVWNVYWAPSDGGPERRLTDHDSPALYVRYPDWSPLGDRIAYEYAESVSTVWLTELPPAVQPH
jgi:Tol biopolymer transport system component